MCGKRWVRTQLGRAYLSSGPSRVLGLVTGLVYTVRLDLTHLVFVSSDFSKITIEAAMLC